MANANKHHIGPGSQGKGSGVGGMTDIPDDLIEPNMVLSNRDKSRHSAERGLDSKAVQVEQLQDNPANHDIDQPGDEAGATSRPGSDEGSDRNT